MSRTSIFKLIPLFLFATLAWGAVIDGVVIENRTGKPLARARITIEALKNGTHGPPVYSDSKGAFRVENLAEGTYRIIGERAGFVAGRFGQSSYDSSGSPVTLAADGHFFAQLRLQRPGAIAGQVLDENGVGIPGFPVSAYRIGTRPKMVASVMTDDRGIYRIAALGPARYAVITGARTMEEGRQLVPTYHGGVVRLEQARLVEVMLDNEVNGVNLEPQTGQLSTIRGSVNASGIVAVQMLGNLGMQEAAVRADGSFEFRGVAAGTYTFVATSNPSLSSAETIAINGADRFVNLKLGPNPQVQLNCVDSTGKAAGPAVVVFLEREILADDQERRLDCGKTVEIPAGSWRVRPLALSGAYLEDLLSSRITPEGEQRLATGPTDSFHLTAASGEAIEVVAKVGTRAARIKGAVRARGGDPVVAIPVGMVPTDDRLRQLMGGARLTRADANGSFQLDGLAPGEYRIFASPGLDSVTAVENFGPGGLTVRVEAGDEREADLRWEQ